MRNAVNYLNSLGAHRINLSLDRISKILEAFDNPHNKLASIIIAGTNGKGSVAAITASILSAAGFKVGLYTSPHLVNISERITVNDEVIFPSDLSRLIMKIKGKASMILTEQPTYFEVLTAVAFQFFHEKQVDCAVLEVGMGGRFDATNVANPIVSVITNIHLDHTEYLGNNIEKIAYEKSGVIKYGVPVVTGADGSALDVIRTVAEKKSASVLYMGRDFSTKSENSAYFDYRGHSFNLINLHLSLPGLYQVNNAALAIATIETLCERYGIDIDEKSLRTGLSTATWEGRMETLTLNPPLILDGAHNPSAAYALRSSLTHAYPEQKFLFLIGMLADKDHENYVKQLSPITEGMIITEIPSERRMPSEDLARIAGSYVDSIRVIKDSEAAFVELKKHNATPACITGSLYLIGAIKKLIKGNPESIRKE
ncbi:MAG: folylpolyglutamate synthase/dihydrofolate synthase family protein [Thermodesulfobacteriota bacterium]